MAMALRTVLVWLGLSALCGSAAASCGSAFCVLNTMWGTQGVPVEPGAARVDMRFEYINQNQLRSGTRRISQAEDTADTTELRTINRNLQTTFDYALSKSWALSAAMPIIDRAHSHIADPTGAATPEQWNFTRIGDLRLLGLYSFNNEAIPFVNSGLTFGVKLPTGDYRVRNVDGTTAERALQPGTGSTDAIVGAFYAAPGFGADSSWWIQGLVQQAIQTKDDFRPGTQLQLNFGYRHPLTESLQGLLQLNTLVKARDS